jgi:hypothetical protein
MELDKNVTSVIVKKYGLEYADWKQVEFIDNLSLRTESVSLLPSKGIHDVNDIEPLGYSIIYHDPCMVEVKFIEQFNKLHTAFIPT